MDKLADKEAPQLQILKFASGRAFRMTAATLDIWSASGAFAIRAAIIASFARRTLARRMCTFFLVFSHEMTSAQLDSG